MYNHYPYRKKTKSFEKIYPNNLIYSEYKDKRPELKDFDLNEVSVVLLKEKIQYFQNILKRIDVEAENYCKIECEKNKKRKNIIIFVSLILTILLGYLILCVKLNQDLGILLLILFTPLGWIIIGLIQNLIMKIFGVKDYIFFK